MADRIIDHSVHLRHRSDELKKDVNNRLKSAAGHLNGVMRMVDEDQYCIDVINQIYAVQAALDKVSVKLLDDHMHHCVTEAVQGDDAAERERVLGEIRLLFEQRNRR